MLDLATTQQKINNLVASVGDMSRAYSTVFFDDTPQTVELDVYDENGDLKTVYVPNLAKVRQGLVFPAAYFRDSLWAVKGSVLTADRKTLRSPDSLWLNIGGAGYRLTGYATLDLEVGANWDSLGTDWTLPANRVGRDFYVYACEPTSGDTPVLLLSSNSTYPDGFTADNSRKVAGFHCLCADIDHQTSLSAWTPSTTVVVGESRRAVSWDGRIYRCIDGGDTGTAEPNWSAAALGDQVDDGTTKWIVEEHALEGFLSGDILPASVWDINHRPVCSPEGMLWSEAAQLWIDIYLQSGTGGSTASANGGTITDTRTWIDHVDDLGAVGKRLLDDMAFQLAAKGSNEQSSYADSEASIPTATGGHVDMFGRRMVSDIGLEDMTGIRVQLLTETTTWLLSESLSVAALISENRGLLMGYGITSDVFLNADNMNEAPSGSFSWGQMRAGGHWFLTHGGGSCCRTTMGGDRMIKMVYVSARGCAPIKIH